MSDNGKENAVAMIVKGLIQERIETLGEVLCTQVQSVLEGHSKTLMKMIVCQQYQIAMLTTAMEELAEVMIDKGVLTKEDCDQLLKRLEGKNEDGEDGGSGDEEERIYGSTNTSSSQSA